MYATRRLLRRLGTQYFGTRTADFATDQRCLVSAVPRVGGLRVCKNRPAPFPGRMSYKTYSLSLDFLSVSVVPLTRDSF